MFLKEFTEKKNESAYNSVLNNIKMAESFCIKLKFVVAIFTSLIHNPLCVSVPFIILINISIENFKRKLNI